MGIFWQQLLTFFNKLRGDRTPLPAKASHRAVLYAGLGGFFAIAVISVLGSTLSLSLLLGSFGASCVLVFGYPDVPFSQPRNVIFGHVMSTLVGLICLKLFGVHWWAVASAVAVSIACMMLTRTVHPPAGSNPVIVFLLQPAWSFVLYPTLLGAVILVMVALVYNNLTRAARYPKYW